MSEITTRTARPCVRRIVGRLSGMVLVAAACIAVITGEGCTSAPELTRSGFLSDYSMLQSDGNSAARFSSPQIGAYESFIVDPVEVRVFGDALTAEERAEAARYFRNAFVRVIESQGLSVVNRPGVGVARVRLALTDVAGSTWWKKLHPASRVAGAGTGGAAMEGEVIDSVTGKQLGAVVQAGSGTQFDFTAFSTLADVKSAIDKWAEHAGARLKELRAAAR